jgi:tetratricopeptide (TPR) repeat protein
MPRRSKFDVVLCLWPFLTKTCLVLLLTLAAIPAVHSKDVPITAIELYDGPNGAAFVQLTGLLINGKAEVRSCAGVAQINKSNYGKLPKIAFSPSVTSLERDAKGTMTLTHGAEPECVVPTNLKFEKDESLTPAQLADRATLSGQVVSSSVQGVTTLPPFKPTVKIVFVQAPDTELAEYLRATRAHSVAQWQDYLARYPKAAHTDAAKQSIATLLLADGNDALAAYRSSAPSATPAYAQLRTAFLRAEQAHELVPANNDAVKLHDAVHAELVLVADKIRTELQEYKQALGNHTTGYSHLALSQQLTQQALGVDPHFDQGTTLETAVTTETKRVESAIQSGQSNISAQHYDEAVAAVSDFRSFADEEPRILVIVDKAYQYHFARGQADTAAQKWSEAVPEYQKAVSIKSTSEATAALKQAQTSLRSATDQAAANNALQQSNAFEQDKKFIDAYEVVADLPDSQRTLVRDRVATLEPAYVKAASDEAKRMMDAHNPIQGRADEIGVQQAYNYLQRACNLEPDNQNLKLRRDLSSQTLSDYYVARAKVYLDKPLGSGVGIAWLYLQQAQKYQPNRDDIRDERTKYSSVHNIRSTLSIKVVFRDQTSRRDSSGFADQLSDAIATGLETTALPVRIIRAADTTPIDANFQLIGDVVEHRPVAKPSIESLDSEYLVGTRDIPNEEWNKANREYETAKEVLQQAQKNLDTANLHGKKKDISAAQQTVDDAQKKADALGRQLDSVPKTKMFDIVKPYSYTKRTIDLSAIVELGFRITDSAGSVIASNPSIKKQSEKQFTVLENVKPEDTKGVKPSGTLPDENQFLGDVEIEARADLIKDVKEKVQTLPGKILAQARKRFVDGDTDGSAEEYILYLNSTPETQTPERDEAKKFLHDQFNMVWPESAA